MTQANNSTVLNNLGTVELNVFGFWKSIYENVTTYMNPGNGSFSSKRWYSFLAYTPRPPPSQVPALTWIGDTVHSSLPTKYSTASKLVLFSFSLEIELTMRVLGRNRHRYFDIIRLPVLSERQDSITPLPIYRFKSVDNMKVFNHITSSKISPKISPDEDEHSFIESLLPTV